MNKVSLYTLLILIFLGLSKSFSPSEQKTHQIVNERVFSNYFKGAPLSILLIDAFQAGFIIKTYYLKLKIIHGFKQAEEVVVRTSPAFYERLVPNLGMSIFRRYERDRRESTIPMPPGTIYIGDPAYGRWDYADSGEKLWYFHRAYRHFPAIFYWGDFQPNYEFYQRMKVFIKNEKPFYGLNEEFGTNGSVTSKQLSEHVKDRTEFISKGIMKYLHNFIQLPKDKIKVEKK